MIVILQVLIAALLTRFGFSNSEVVPTILHSRLDSLNDEPMNFNYIKSETSVVELSPELKKSSKIALSTVPYTSAVYVVQATCDLNANLIASVVYALGKCISGTYKFSATSDTAYQQQSCAGAAITSLPITNIACGTYYASELPSGGSTGAVVSNLYSDASCQILVQATYIYAGQCNSASIYVINPGSPPTYSVHTYIGTGCTGQMSSIPGSSTGVCNGLSGTSSQITILAPTASTPNAPTASTTNAPAGSAPTAAQTLTPSNAPTATSAAPFATFAPSSLQVYVNANCDSNGIAYSASYNVLDVCNLLYRRRYTLIDSTHVQEMNYANASCTGAIASRTLTISLGTGPCGDYLTTQLPLSGGPYGTYSQLSYAETYCATIAQFIVGFGNTCNDGYFYQYSTTTPNTMDRFEYANANCTGSVQHVVNLNSFGCVSGQDGSYSGLVIPPNTYFQFTSAPSGARPTYKSTAFPTATPVASTVSFSLQHLFQGITKAQFLLVQSAFAAANVQAVPKALSCIIINIVEQTIGHKQDKSLEFITVLTVYSSLVFANDGSAPPESTVLLNLGIAAPTTVKAAMADAAQDSATKAAINSGTLGLAGVSNTAFPSSQPQASSTSSASASNVAVIAAPVAVGAVLLLAIAGFLIYRSQYNPVPSAPDLPSAEAAFSNVPIASPVVTNQVHMVGPAAFASNNPL